MLPHRTDHPTAWPRGSALWAYCLTIEAMTDSMMGRASRKWGLVRDAPFELDREYFRGLAVAAWATLPPAAMTAALQDLMHRPVPFIDPGMT